MIDVLVIGAGGAGLTSAIEATSCGSKVLVVSQAYPTRSQTSMAQGGINAVLDTQNDSIKNHIEDTIKASRGYADKDMVTLMCEKAPETIKWLDSIGVPFSRTKDVKIAQRRLGGVKHKRACYSQDYTGLKIIQTLYDKALSLGVEFRHRYYLLDLIIEDKISKGALFLDIKDMQVVTIKAKATILATGGYGGIFHSYTTNNHSQNGDSIALALCHDIEVSNLGFVQFHPTGLKSSSVLISESARGAGGKLINSDGKRFVDELKPRDEVSQAILKEIESGKDVFLDITSLGEEFIDENLPQERKLSIFYEGVDPVKEPIPIKPVAHYSMGGIKVDKRMQTSIKNLFAVGECSESGVHGKNRLGGNSLLEIVAFGRVAGKEATKVLDFQDFQKLHSFDIEKFFESKPTINFYEKQRELGRVLYLQAGIVKTKDKLQKALKFVEDLERDLPKMGVVDKSRVLNTNLVEFLKFKNTIKVAKSYVEQSLEDIA